MMRFKGKVAHKFAESPLLQLSLPPWRSRLMALLILGSFAVLIGRAFYLQILNNDFLQEKGESRYRRDIEISASRGRIADRHGDVLAISTPMKSIWAIPPATTLTSEQSKQLAALLETDPKQLSRKLDTEKTFVFLRRQIPPPVAEQVAALKLPGIGQNKEYRRFYPTGEMTAHMVGFTGVDDKGLEGVELAFHGQLLGEPGSRSVIKDRRGQNRRRCRFDQAAAGRQGHSSGARLEDPVPGLQSVEAGHHRQQRQGRRGRRARRPDRRDPGTGQLANL
jgi:cell division protein FtsI (penicillin-binding protein 3)